MRTAEAEDLTARARIREAALFCFARDGFGASLRTIAQEAKVSVALITHHYGTKDNLRQVCDDHVLARYRDMKLLAVAQPSSVGDSLTDNADSSILTVYMLRSLLAAGPTAQRFFDHFLTQIETVMQASFAAGLIKESAMAPEKIRLMAADTMGGLLITFATNPPDDPRDFVDQAFTAERLLNQLELYRDGFFTDSPVFDQYIAAIKEWTHD
ncbi:MAG: TetR family transcriptional regulator [Propionibacteriaceae bacterium]|jgi:AcrR family transcriptional regulator|nr:TetR family transcriptional regulator [Propionibacteriaceae bacterium]